MSARPRFRAAIAALLCAALAATAAVAFDEPAGARDGGAKSRIKVKKLRASGAKGEVTSGRKSCERKGRKVSLFRYEGFVSDKVAITYTKRGGGWRVRRSLKPGKYFAKVDASKGCRYAVSRNKWL